MQFLRRALHYLRPYWLIALGAFISLSLVSAANLTSPYILQFAIDEGITPGNLAIVGYATIFLVIIAAVRGLFSFTQGYWIEKASQSAAYDMRNDLFRHISSLSFSYHDQVRTGQLMTRVTNDVDQVRLFVGNGFVQITSALVILFGSATILLVMNWQLALIALATVPMVALIFTTFFRIVGQRFRQVQQKLGMLNNVLQENLSGIRVIKAFAREPYELDRYGSANDELLHETLVVRRGIAMSFPAIFFISNLGTLGIIWFGGEQVIGGTLSIGELVAFNTYLTFLIQPVMMIGFASTAIAQADASARRMFEVLDAPIEVTDTPGAVEMPNLHGRVVFEDVTFRYSESDNPTLQQVSFTVESGQTVAILGRTGAGKTSVINLIPRFYDVSAGRVLIDGHDVRNVTLSSLRRQIGIVLQETTLFSGTIRENIAYGSPDASQEKIEAVAIAAQAHDFIRNLPDGYNTIIGERGIGLSGGQRQRIAIARTLLLDPALIILDDSTSAVDAETEHHIQQALERLLQGRTAFVIAQRLSTVRHADLILLLDKGELVNQGTYDYLLEHCGQFCELLEERFAVHTSNQIDLAA